MAIVTKLDGLSEVLKNLRKKEGELAVAAERGLKRAGLLLQRESQKKVPVEFGPLKNSAFTRHEGKGWDTVVNVGYTVAYALYVHEAVGMVLKGLPRPSGRGKYWDPQPQASAKFLEEPARRLAPELTRMIKESCMEPLK